MPDDMKLPEGKTCASCFHLQKCVELFGGDPSYEYCSFSPSRYIEKAKTNKNYALVELVGRQQIAGFVSDAMIEGSPFIKVEVPATKVHRKNTCYFSIESVYAISPMGEAQVLNLTFNRERGRYQENAEHAVEEFKTTLLKAHRQVSIKKGRRVK